MIKENKAFLIIDLNGEIGGGQKRNIVLCDYILKHRDDFILIINDKLFENFNKHSLIDNNRNIRILKLRGARHKIKVSKSEIHANEENKVIAPPYMQVIRELGRIKKMLRLFFIWIHFSIQFYKIVKINNISAIYALWMGGMWAWPFKKILNLKLTYGYNDADLSWLSKKRVDFLDSEYWVMKHCDKIDFLSEGIKNNFNNKIFNIAPERVVISPCSFIIYDNYYPEYPKENNVTFLGRFVPERNLFLILEAIKICQNSINWNSNLNFYFIGDGPEKNNVIQYIERNKLVNIHLTGKSFYPWKYLRKSRIFITVATENYPSQSLLEAMACENAIIASDVGETRNLLTEKEAILVPLEAEKIAKAILYLVENTDVCERLGQHARIKATENHNIEKYINYFYSIIDDK
jgi:glycosyltransferase involved in cell wall biosynthesis